MVHAYVDIDQVKFKKGLSGIDEILREAGYTMLSLHIAERHGNVPAIFYGDTDCSDRLVRVFGVPLKGKIALGVGYLGDEEGLNDLRQRGLDLGEIEVEELVDHLDVPGPRFGSIELEELYVPELTLRYHDATSRAHPNPVEERRKTLRAIEIAKRLGDIF